MSRSCIVREFPIPEREYRAAAPSRWDRQTAPPPRRRRVQQRRRPLRMSLVLAGLALFCCGFLLGRAAAVPERSRRAPSAGTSQSSAAIQPEEPTPGGVRVLTVPGAEFHGSGDGSGSQDAASDWKLLLVNGEHPLPQDYAPPELTQLKNGHAIDSRAYPDLQAMMDAARAAGYRPLICSSFRTWDKQSQLFERKTAIYISQGHSREEAEAQAAVWVARPGTSEHQAALAVDIVDTDYQLLDQAQEDRPVQQWLMAHCAEYGFILRYPTAKSGLTGVGYEPWHYRYVGREAARAIMDGGLCLEEYLAR